MDVRKPEIPTSIPERQAFVVDPQQMQKRRMQIMHMHLVLLRVKPKVVRGTPSQTGLDPRPTHPPSKRMRIVIPTVVPLRRWRPPEFPTPNQKRLAE